MDRLTFGDGISYEKASVIAKRFRYTADYVGQLCRAHKVDARLVGRTWYVNPESLEKHRAQKNRPAEKILNNKDILDKSRINVEPVIGKNTSRALRFVEHRNSNLSVPTKYTSDDQDLYPAVIRLEPATVKSLRVEVAEATGLRIHASKKITHFKAAPLPVVSLHGRIPVEAVESTEVLDEPVKPVQADAPRVTSDSVAKPVDIRQLKRTVAATAQIIPDQSLRTVESAPESVSRSRILLAPSRPLLLMATVLVLVVVSATFFISSEYHVSAAGSWSKMGFDTTQLTALLSYVSYTHGEQI